MPQYAPIHDSTGCLMASVARQVPIAVWLGSGNVQYAEINGSKYGIRPLIGGGWAVTRNGIEIAGPSCVDAPAGFRTAAAAKHHAEWHGDMNPA